MPEHELILIDLGSIILSQEDGHFMLLRPDGEGMEIGEQVLGKLLSDYYDENF